MQAGDDAARLQRDRTSTPSVARAAWCLRLSREVHVGWCASCGGRLGRRAEGASAAPMARGASAGGDGCTCRLHRHAAPKSQLAADACATPIGTAPASAAAPSGSAALTGSAEPSHNAARSGGAVPSGNAALSSSAAPSGGASAAHQPGPTSYSSAGSFSHKATESSSQRASRTAMLCAMPKRCACSSSSRRQHGGASGGSRQAGLVRRVSHAASMGAKRTNGAMGCLAPY